MKPKTEQQQIFEDVYNGIIPKRVPINATFQTEYAILNSGYDLGKTQWTLEGIEATADKLCNIIPSDVAPLGSPRYPAYLTFLGAKTYEMGISGFMQHPEIKSMQPEDYDEFIKAPRDFIIGKIMPRLMTNLSDDPIESAIIFAESMLANQDYQKKHMQMVQSLRTKHDFYTPPARSISGSTVPFDYLSDFLRGFTGIVRDVKKCPEKILEACEALIPFLIKKSLPQNPSIYGQTFMPLHMATYLREKEFAKLYYPSFLKFIHILRDFGQPAHVFCEANWMRYLDYLYELPEGTRFTFEYGDPKIIKEKLGKKHIISGLYPLTYLRTATKEQCVDKCKELIDILAPGGNFIFSFDKNPFVLNDINLENYIAILDYVKNNTNYDNAGCKSLNENIELKYHKEDIPPYTSKYQHCDQINSIFTQNLREDLKSTATNILSNYENQVMDFLTKIL